MVEKIEQLLLVTLVIKGCGHFQVFRSGWTILHIITSYSLGSNYPKTVELSSPILNAYKS